MAWWIWIILGAVLLGAEMIIAADFYLVFFGVSGLLMGLALLVGLDLPSWSQWLIYATVAILLLVTYRTRLKTSLTKPDQELDAEIVDEVGVASEDIAAGSDGKIELRGTSWSVRNVGDQDMKAGDPARVIEKTGLLLRVRSDH
jgi:inner membrane protein